MGCQMTKKALRIQASEQTIVRQKTVLQITVQTFLKVSTGGLSSSYRVIGSMDSGSVSEVKKCFHTPTNQFRALKMVYKSSLVSGHFDQQSSELNEINSLRELDHPSVLRVYDIFEDEESYQIITDLCEGGRLSERIEAITEEDASHVMLQLLSALAYCHSKSIVHRDLKPENIYFISPESWQIKIGDFGSSAKLSRRRKISGKFGSAFYVAPEIFSAHYNEKCDLWSCGIILYMMLSKKVPYAGNNEEEILSIVKKSPLSLDGPESGISDLAWTLLKKLLAIDYRARISASAALTHPWIKQRKPTKSINISDTMGSLMNYKKKETLKKAVSTFLALQMIDQEDSLRLKNAFMVLDKNGDGVIDREELISYFKQTMPKNHAIKRVENIMNTVDADRSGYINYSEFISVCLQESGLKNREALKFAFEKFDVDCSGDITSEELRTVLEGNQVVEGEVWEQIISEADKNSDGKVDLNEFLGLMGSRF